MDASGKRSISLEIFHKLQYNVRRYNDDDKHQLNYNKVVCAVYVCIENSIVVFHFY